MKLFDKIQSDMYQAMKVKDTVKSKTLRVVFAKLLLNLKTKKLLNVRTCLKLMN
jgi:uncharacterized protein YqeY